MIPVSIFFILNSYHFSTQIHSGIWPTTVHNLKVAFFCVLAYLIVDPEFSKPLTKFLWEIGEFFAIDVRMPFWLRSLLLSALVSFLFFVTLLYTRRYLLRCLLAYRGWMYRSNNSGAKVKTLGWCAAVRVISGLAQPTLYSCQLSLPRMPVPSVKETMNRLFRSLQPLYADKPEQLAVLKKEADEFLSGPAVKLNRYLRLKSWWAPNYVSDWWEKYVYLRSRSPLPNNSNFYMIASPYWVPTCKATARAATLSAAYLDFKLKIDHETMEPLLIHNSVPLCMNQYERFFSTTRIPGDEFDEILQFKDSNHIAVSYKHCWFKVPCYSNIGEPYRAKHFEATFDAIVNEVENGGGVDPDKEESMVPALTALDRTRWSAARRQLINSGEINRKTLNAIESAMFIVVIEHRSFSDANSRGEYSLHGDGRTLWFDKTIQAIAFADGHLGSNVEHTPADAPVIGHLNELFLSSEIADKLYDEQTGAVFDLSRATAKIKPPQSERLYFDLGPAEEPKAFNLDQSPVKLGSLRSTVRFAYDFAVRNNSEVHLVIFDHDKFGKGVMKKCKVSPDSFVQMALQLAYLRDQGKVALTYESSMTRLYLQGRTETIRSLTPEAYEFIKAMDNPKVSKEEKQKLV